MMQQAILEQIKKMGEEIAKLTDVEEQKSSKVYSSIAEKEFLTSSEVLAYLSISPITLQKWREKGLKFIKMGDGKTDKLFYSKKSIEAFLLQYEC